AKLMHQEVTLAQSLRRAKALSYDVVAGVPVGGLLLAVAYALEASVPLIYSRPQPEGTGERGIEGRYSSGSRALLIDDLIAGGTSIQDTARFLAEHDILVHDAVVLVDRDLGAQHRLKQMGINLISILKLDVMMNLYHADGLITEEQYQGYLTYAHSARAQAHEEYGGISTTGPQA
ncbi:MAG TPA: phosphoribosyltransferase family protein, partial [Ktedonobacterales bacterium]